MRRLPGIQPLAPDLWLIRDEAYGAQMAERGRLIATHREAVHAMRPEAEDAAWELYDLVLADLAPRPGTVIGAAEVLRPDGVRVPLEGPPLVRLGRLVQEDFCLLQPGPEGPVLTGAILCFPASWLLAEKIGRPLGAVHGPVPQYDGMLAARVDRLCAGLAPGRPLWRANAHFYTDPALFQPRPEAAPRAKVAGPAPYLRSERQVLVRLPRTRAVVFSIHTYVVATESLSAAQRAALEAHPIGYDPARPA